MLLITVMIAVVFVFSCKDQNGADKSLMAKETSVKTAESGPYRGYEFKEGMERARATGKPVVIYFFTKWCTYCRAMDRMVFSDSEVIEQLRDNFVYIRIDTEENGTIRYKNHELKPVEFAMMMGVQGFPTTVYFDKSQSPVTKIPGFMQKEMFLNFLSYMGDECYVKNVNFESYERGKTRCRADRSVQ